jgi:hypothetical protein
MARKQSTRRRSAPPAPVAVTFIATVAEPGEPPFTVLLSGEPEKIAAFVAIARSRAVIHMEVCS